MPDTIHIASTIDDSFCLPLSAMLVSLFETNEENRFKIHLISANLKDENVKHIEIIVKQYNQHFEYYKISLELFKRYPINDRISYAAYYRIIIPSIIDKGIERYIYIDADTIITGNIKALWDFPLEGKTIGAIHDISVSESKYYRRHNISDEFQYFNSGVLLVDRYKWEENNVTERTRDYLTTHGEKCRFHDQDGLNAILFNDRLNLPPRFNQQIGLYFMNKPILHNAYGANEVKNALKDPVIVHFNGREKPWDFLCGHPFRKKFTKYLRISKTENSYNDKTLKNRIKMLGYFLLGWGNVTRYYYNKTKAANYNAPQQLG